MNSSVSAEITSLRKELIDVVLPLYKLCHREVGNLDPGKFRKYALEASAHKVLMHSGKVV